MSNVVFIDSLIFCIIGGSIPFRSSLKKCICNGLCGWSVVCKYTTVVIMSVKQMNPGCAWISCVAIIISYGIISTGILSCCCC